MFSRRICLELGAGVGLTGIVAMKVTRAQHTILTDYHEKVLNNLKENLEINGINLTSESERISVCQLDWRAKNIHNLPLLPHILFAADVIYDPDLVKDFVQCLSVLFKAKRSDCCAYVATTLRNQTTFNYFLDKLKECGLKHNDITKNVHIIPLFQNRNNNTQNQIVVLSQIIGSE